MLCNSFLLIGEQDIAAPKLGDMDAVWRGQPFVNVVAKLPVSTGLDDAYQGEPFYAPYIT